MSVNHSSARSAARPGRSRPGKAVLLAVSLLLLSAGGAIGSGLTALHFRSALTARQQQPEVLCHLITSRLSDSVAISPDEMTAIRAVVENDVTDAARIRREFDTAMRGRMSEMCEAICEILGPERAHACTALIPPGGTEFP